MFYIYIYICSLQYCVCSITNMYVLLVVLDNVCGHIFMFGIFFNMCICVMLCLSASIQEKTKHTAHPFIPGKRCFVSRTNSK